MSEQIKVASFFAGIGGICYGFEQAGANVVWANELDKYCCITYRQNFKNTFLLEKDINLINTNDVPDVDIICGGFPCQAFSIAGYQKGFNDKRGILFFKLAEIIKSKKPKIVFLENVKNLLSHDKGKTFKKILSILEEMGYFVKYKVLNTKDYGNIPQNRERVYIVAFKNKKHYLTFNFPEPIKLTKKISDIIKFDKKQNDLYYYSKNSRIYNELINTIKDKSVYQWRRVYCRKNKSNVCPTLTANMGTGGHNVPIIKDNFGIRKLTPNECIAFQGFPKKFNFPSCISNGNKYKQAGNSVSVPVIKRIAKEIIKII